MGGPLDLPWADATVVIDATVDDDLRAIAGTITVTSTQPYAVVDPLADLPLPTDDHTRLLVGSGRAERGKIAFERLDDDTWRFTTAMPRRWEDVGTSTHGLFANGAWYPTPLFADAPGEEAQLKVVDWVVRIELPAGAAGAVGDIAGTGTLRWSGSAERAALAVVPRGVVTPIREDHLALDLVTRGAPRHRLVRELTTEVARARPESLDWHAAVVEAPLRRRLARSGPGLAYVSDRAFRVAPPLVSFHRPAVVRAVIAASLEVDVPEWRALSAAALARRYERALPGLSASRVLKLGAFTPSFEAMLYDERMPFYGDLLGRTIPSDALRDDLVERWWPHEPAMSVVRQIEALDGPLAPDVVWKALSKPGRGWQTFAELGLSPQVDLLGRPWPSAHDLTLRVDRAAGTYALTRDAVPGAPEVVTLAVDGARVAYVLSPGETLEQPLGEARHLRVDPSAQLALVHRSDDAWPPRASGTVSGGIWTIDPADRVVVANVMGTLRRSQDTHLRAFAAVSADRTMLPAADLGAAWQFGRAIDGLRHAERIAGSIGFRRFDPRYVPVDPDRRYAVAAALSWRHDTREDAFFPLSGARVAARVEAGRVLGDDLMWLAGRASAGFVASPHPRHALATELSTAVAASDVEHERLSLGGEEALLCVAPAAVLGELLGVARAEWRYTPVRGASIPVLPQVLWASELQFTVGAEAGLLAPNRAAVGVTAGAAVIGDWLGVDPSMLGVTAGLPVQTTGFQAPRTPQWTLRFAQAW